MVVDMDAEIKTLSREILLSLWKVHILHHAREGPVVGMWMLKELRSHGYELSPGTLYPLLQRMERNGWLRSEADPSRGSRSIKKYYLTPKGQEVLEFLRERIRTLWEEIS